MKSKRLRKRTKTRSILSIQVDSRHRQALRKVMREQGFRTASEAARYLIEKEASQASLEDTLRRIRALGKGYRGPKVNAAEDHDAFLAGVEH